MRAFALGFLIGTAALQQMAALPAWPVGLTGLASLLACALCRGGARLALLLVAGVLLGHGHAAWRAQERLAHTLPAELDGRDVRLSGSVAGLPQPRSGAMRFLFEVEGAGSDLVLPSRVMLAWYPDRAGAGIPQLVPGDRWELTARLRKPRGLANPHGFDFEAWAFARGIHATGHVRTKDGVKRAGRSTDAWHALDRWRAQIREAMQRRLEGSRLGGVLVALALGEQDAIAAADWNTFWRTGVGHLMSISGLHITMLAALAYGVAWHAWARVPPLASRWPARKAAVVAGVSLALAYALMTGFAVPAQRTVVMLAVASLCVLVERHASGSRVLALAMLAVLALDPWAVLAPGFWLSFGAVAGIFHAMALRTGRAAAGPAALREQAAVTVAMAPMLVALFGELSVVGPLANALAIPVVSLVVVPLTLAAAFLGAWPLLDVAHAAMTALMVPLEALSSWEGATLESPPPAPWAVALALAGGAWLLAPRGVPMRSCGALCMAPLLAVQPARPAPGTAWVDVLDVGHGLAIVVRTARHALVYDAGPSWDEGSDSGRRIVVPFLRGEGIARLDGLVVSHADDDHAGGAAAVAALRRPAWMLSSLDAADGRHALVPRSSACAAGPRWEWDGVRFAVLHPVAGEPVPRRENDRSCVLRVATAGASALLTGDIEARSEARLLARDAASLRADVLLVPHHGSRSSSTPAFVEAVAPSLAVASVGHLNRFGHPHPAVAARFAARGIVMHRTDRSGALRIVLPAESGGPATVQPHARVLRYWSTRRPP